MLPEIRQNVPLSTLTTMGVGGEAEHFAVASSEEEMSALVGYARERGYAVTILGGGSNVLVRDEGVKGLVIRNEIKGISKADAEDGSTVLVSAGAGEDWDSFVAHTVNNGWWGLENLSSIPGTVGATPIQNVGAYGVEVGNVIDNVRVYSEARGEFLNLSAADCRFGYRDSLFKTAEGKELVVVGVTYRLNLKENPVLHYKDLQNFFGVDAHPTQADIRSAVIVIRSRKFPDWHALGTAGSFFKNPIIGEEHFRNLLVQYPELPGFPETDGRVKVSLGWILDKVCGLKGARQGNVGTYEAQSLVLVNYGGATTNEILSFADYIIESVKEKTEINIEREPVLI